MPPGLTYKRPLSAYQHMLTVDDGVSAPAHILRINFCSACPRKSIQHYTFTAIPPPAALYKKGITPTHSSSTVYGIVSRHFSNVKHSPVYSLYCNKKVAAKQPPFDSDRIHFEYTISPYCRNGPYIQQRIFGKQ